MKTGIQMVQDCFQLINISEVLNLMTGKGYLFERPQNSELQDFVVSTLALSNDQLQEGIINVNLHCPNLSLTLANKTDNTMPDTASFIAIGNVIVGILNDYLGFDFRLSVSIPGILLRDEKDGEFFLNIRVNYYAFQPNYSNI